jgi:D-alanyl-D-alanine carboxypeptidase
MLAERTYKLRTSARVPATTRGCAAGRSQSSSETSSLGASEMQPFVGWPRSAWMKMADPSPGTTSAFNCRYAVATGPKRWSVHACGEAIDVDSLENPYLLDGTVYPPAGRPYLDRLGPRPGMAEPGGELVAAFAASGWQWGGRCTASPDYQHFSSNGG